MLGVTDGDLLVNYGTALRCIFGVANGNFVNFVTH